MQLREYGCGCAFMHAWLQDHIQKRTTKVFLSASLFTRGPAIKYAATCISFNYRTLHICHIKNAVYPLVIE